MKTRMGNQITDLRTNKKFQEAYEYLCDYDNCSEYQEKLSIVLDALDFALVRIDSLKESLDVMTSQWLDLYNKQKSCNM